MSRHNEQIESEPEGELDSERISAIMRYTMGEELSEEGLIRKEETVVQVGQDDGSSWPDYIKE